MPTILITGANRGLGLGLARHFQAKGWHVIAAVRDPMALAAMLSGPGIEMVPLELGDPYSIKSLGEWISGRPLDVFISNAAKTGGDLGSFGAFDVDRFLEYCRINAAAPMKLLEVLAGSLIATGGKALMVSSRIGATPFYGYVEYFASKTALNQLVKQASLALAAEGVTVAACHPGWVETEATGAMGRAPLTPDSAAPLLAAILDQMTIADAGKFFDPDGSELPIVPQQHDVRFYSKPRDAVI